MSGPGTGGVPRAPGLAEPHLVRWVLTAVALAFLGLFLLVPLAIVFGEAFARGAPAYLAAIQEPNTVAAIRLTLLVVAIALPLNLPPEAAPYDESLTWERIARACLAAPAERPPGTRVQYSNVGYSLLALVVERVEAKPDGWRRLPEYRDPVDREPFNTDWLASVEPVVVRAADGKDVDTGFVVLVQEKRDEALRPVRELQWRLGYWAGAAVVFVILLVLTMWAGMMQVLDASSRSRVSSMSLRSFLTRASWAPCSISSSTSARRRASRAAPPSATSGVSRAALSR